MEGREGIGDIKFSVQIPVCSYLGNCIFWATSMWQLMKQSALLVQWCFCQCSMVFDRYCNNQSSVCFVIVCVHILFYYISICRLRLCFLLWYYLILSFDCLYFFKYRSDNDPGRYHDGYSRLRTWAYSSLDQYKVHYHWLYFTSTSLVNVIISS